ncbi:carbon monoxide dehydrogenase accessory protein CooC [soil metagenome]
MRIAIAGKGGSGKTTISGTLARVLARGGRSVVAIDADTNPNLAAILGVRPGGAQDLVELPRDLLERRTEPDGSVRSVLIPDPDDVVAEFGVDAPDGVRLLVMGRVMHSGAGCHCRGHATVRAFLDEMVRRADTRDVVVDMEAGLEHLSRGTARHVTRFVAVVEPYFRAMETARRVAELALELGVEDVVAVANKVRDEEDRAAIGGFCASHGIRLAGEIPFDPELARAERAGAAPLDFAPDSAAVRAIRELTQRLVAPIPAG